MHNIDQTDSQQNKTLIIDGITIPSNLLEVLDYYITDKVFRLLQSELVSKVTLGIPEGTDEYVRGYKEALEQFLERLRNNRV